MTVCLGLKLLAVTVAVMGSPTITSVGCTEQLAAGVSARRTTQAEYNAGAQAHSFEARTAQIGKIGRRKIGVVVPAPDIVGFKQPPRNILVDGKSIPPPRMAPMPLLRVQAVDAYAIQTHQSMQEIISIVGAPDEARPDRNCGFVRSRQWTAPAAVVTEVGFPSPMRIEIVGEGCAPIPSPCLEPRREWDCWDRRRQRELSHPDAAIGIPRIRHI